MTEVTRWFQPPVAISTVDAIVKAAAPMRGGTPDERRPYQTAIMLP